MWRHTRHGDRYVTVIIDLTPIRDGTGVSRLLDMVEGCSKHTFKTWLAARPKTWRDGVEVVAMDGFTGFKTATAEELPDAVAVLDPFHVVRLAGEALDKCRRRVQQQVHGHRGRKGDPLYGARRTLSTGTDLLTPKQQARLTKLFADENHAEVEVTWAVYSMIAAYRHDDPKQDEPDGRTHRLPHHRRPPSTVRADHARPDPETTRHRRAGLLRPRVGTSNGPTEAINGRLNTLRAPRWGFGTSPTTSPARSSKPAASDPNYTPNCEEPFSLCLRQLISTPLSVIASIRDIEVLSDTGKVLSESFF
ncbi:MAG: transposase [Tessaracoccus sp.]